MIVKAEGKFIRVSPKKVRRVASLLSGQDISTAESLLLNMNNRTKEFLIKLLHSAVANAKVKGFNREQLYISKIICDNGPIWKRFRAVAFGRANLIRRRTSHIKIELDLKA